MMQEIMGDRKQIYEKMSDHLYWLGLFGGINSLNTLTYLTRYSVGACWLRW